MSLSTITSRHTHTHTHTHTCPTITCLPSKNDASSHVLIKNWHPLEFGSPAVIKMHEHMPPFLRLQNFAHRFCIVLLNAAEQMQWQDENVAHFLAIKINCEKCGSLEMMCEFVCGPVSENCACGTCVGHREGARKVLLCKVLVCKSQPSKNAENVQLWF